MESKPPFNGVSSPISISSTTSNSQEQEIVANIQELQRKLTQLHTGESSIATSASTTTNGTSASSDTIDDKDGSKLEGETSSSSIQHAQRLIMVSNRLPISIRYVPETQDYEYQMSSGGLVTALEGIRKQIPFIWVGWLGIEIPFEKQQSVRDALMKEYNCVPVFLSEEIAMKYYNDFSNNVLWPIFHYVPLPISTRVGSEKKFDTDLWDAYVIANEEFGKVVNGLYRKGDYIWVHDYHLMVLPSYLRKKHPKCKIGWFLHTPFPSSEVYRVLPVRKQILEGLLGADLVGFHTYDYARHFLSACSKLIGLKSTPRGMELENHFVSIGVFPIGIDPTHFEKQLKNSFTKSRVAKLCEKFSGKRIIVGVDRLDYIKGMPHKLLAVEKLLQLYPEWREKVVLVQIGVPSRTGVEEYKQLALRVNELVGRINGTYGTLEHTPIHYINQSVSPQELSALYNASDVCFVTSVRDGMNLVSHEYVVCQNEPCANREGPGVLVLSEFAGSAQSLSGAMRINPWNTDGMAHSLHQALMLPIMERELRHLRLYRYVTTHTASFWAKSYLADLQYASKRSDFVTKLSRLPIHMIMKDYSKSKNRLIICDYDGTLVPWQTVPTMAAPKSYLKKILVGLTQDKRNTVVIVSGRERTLLSSWFSGVRVGIAAESGYFFKMAEDNDWTEMGSKFDVSWTNVVRPIMQYFTDRTPGSFIEAKETALSWHYCDTDAEFGTMQARDMQVHLEDVLSSLPLEVIQGSKVVEVRIQGISKALIVEETIRRLSLPATAMVNGMVDFVLCVGDDHTDEAMFSTIKEVQNKVSNHEVSSPIDTDIFSKETCFYSCHIGTDKSQAMYYLEAVVDLRRLLRALSTISSEQEETA